MRKVHATPKSVSLLDKRRNAAQRKVNTYRRCWYVFGNGTTCEQWFPDDGNKFCPEHRTSKQAQHVN